MKILIIVLLMPLLCNAQKLTTNGIDEFTGHSVKKTNYNMVCYKIGQSVRVGAQSENGLFFLWLRISQPDAFFIDYPSIAYLKLENGIVVKATCASGEISKHDEGVPDFWWGDYAYAILPEDVLALMESPLQKIRIDINAREYIKFDKVKEKHKWAIKETLELVK